MQIISDFIQKKYFLGLESQCCFEIDGTEQQIEDVIVATNVEEEQYEKNNNMPHSGCKITSIDLDREWTSLIVGHVRNCDKCGDIECVESTKRSFELIDVHKCNWCSCSFEKRCSYDVERTKEINHLKQARA